ncbi:MAG: metal-dependent hydrolase [Thermoplasmata archaeon]|nr:metal-dependent hydrolase [Thermoplasmata archaeon]
MDPFSHLLLGYLLGFGVWGPTQLQYVVAAAIAGALPDADVAFFPISRRFPLLRHRGISHSLLGVTVIAVVGCFVVPPAMAWGLGAGFAAGSTFTFFVALEIGGLSHVFLDSLDHWSVPIFAPFSRREYHFDVDRIVNVGSMAFTVIGYALMLYERGRVPVALWAFTTWLLLGAVGVYFVVRILGRWRAGIVQRREGFTAVIPQVNPLVFVLFGEERTADKVRLRYVRYQLLRGFRSAPHSIAFPTPAGGALPIADPAEALALSYPAAIAASWMLGETHHFAEIRPGAGRFEVYWYSLEVNFFGRAAGVLAQVDASSGAVTAHNKWRSPATAFA